MLCGASLGLGATSRCGFLLAQVPGVVRWSAASGCSCSVACVVYLCFMCHRGAVCFRFIFPSQGLFGVIKRFITYGQHLMSITQAIVEYNVACNPKWSAAGCVTTSFVVKSVCVASCSDMVLVKNVSSVDRGLVRGALGGKEGRATGRDWSRPCVCSAPAQLQMPLVAGLVPTSYWPAGLLGADTAASPITHVVSSWQPGAPTECTAWQTLFTIP